MTPIAFGTYSNGRVKLDGPVDWPEGSEVEVTPLSEQDAALLHLPGSREKLIARLIEDRILQSKLGDR
jgi:hypothetical protein